MPSQQDIWYVIRDGLLVKVVENDHYAFVRRGPERREVVLCTVEEAKTRFPKELQRAQQP